MEISLDINGSIEPDYNQQKYLKQHLIKSWINKFKEVTSS